MTHILLIDAIRCDMKRLWWHENVGWMEIEQTKEILESWQSLIDCIIFWYVAVVFEVSLAAAAAASV